MVRGMRMLGRNRSSLFMVLAMLGLLILSLPATAQTAHRAKATVGDQVITQYEVDQRVLMLEALGTAGDLPDIALDQLIKERLQEMAVAQAGIAATGVEVENEIEAFAARGILTADELLARLAAAGVAEPSFRRFLKVAYEWRALVRQRFASRSGIGASELDSALGLVGRNPGLEFQISEIFLPTSTAEYLAITEQLMPQILALTSTAAFEDAARRFSAGPTRDQGGRVANWVALGEMPASLREAMPSARIGQVIGPIEFPGAVGLFQLRAKRETAGSTRGSEVLDYAVYLVATGGQAAATKVLDRVDTCNDLYGVAKGQPDEWLKRQTAPASQIPSPIARALSNLDANEAAVVDHEGTRVVMLCARMPATQDVTALRTQAERDLANRKLNAFADAYLQQLRDETRITLR